MQGELRALPGLVAPDNSVSFAIIGVGGFVGIRKRGVAIPVELLLNRDGRFIPVGATKEASKALPMFDCARPIERDDRNPIFYRSAQQRRSSMP